MFMCPGTVVAGDWDREVFPLESGSAFLSCREHWINKVPWEQTGRYEVMLKEIQRQEKPVSGCSTLEDIVARYERLDKIYETIRKERRFRTREEKSGRKGIYRLLNKEDDVIICIDRNGMPMLAGDGQHRISIARILELPVIPATLGVVHPRGLKYLDSYRKPHCYIEGYGNSVPPGNAIT